MSKASMHVKRYLFHYCRDDFVAQCSALMPCDRHKVDAGKIFCPADSPVAFPVTRAADPVAVNLAGGGALACFFLLCLIMMAEHLCNPWCTATLLLLLSARKSICLVFRLTTPSPLHHCLPFVFISLSFALLWKNSQIVLCFQTCCYRLLCRCSDLLNPDTLIHQNHLTRIFWKSITTGFKVSPIDLGRSWRAMA